MRFQDRLGHNRSMKTKPACIVTGAAVAWVAAVIPATTPPVSAMPPFLNEWQDLYPASLTDDNLDNGGGSSCQVCHAGPFGGPPWNDYGWSVHEEFDVNGGDIVAAILAVQDLNPDNDPTACSSIVEINADTQPGWTDGPNNTFHFHDGSIQENQPPPADVLGDLDPSTSCCPADLDGDGSVGITDFLALLGAWGTPGGDVDGDGTTGITDFLALLGAWGSCS